MQRAIVFSVLILAGLVGLLMAAAQVPVGPSQPAAARTISPPRKHTPAPQRPRPPRGTWLAVVYTGNGNGEVEPCG